MAIVFMGMVILGFVLMLLNRKKQRTWLFVLTLVVDIVALIGCTYYAVQARKTNDAQKEVVVMNEYVIYFDCGFSSTDIHNDGYVVIYATDVRSALDQFESEYDSVDTIREIDVR